MLLDERANQEQRGSSVNSKGKVQFLGGQFQQALVGAASMVGDQDVHVPYRRTGGSEQVGRSLALGQISDNKLDLATLRP
jgi:hypothetical protein